MKRPKGSRSKALLTVVIVLLVSAIIGCSQPAPTPTPTKAPAATPKPAATKEAKPEAKEATPAAKATAPAAKASTPAAKEAKPEDKKLVKVRVAYSAVSGSQAPLWVAKEKKLFEKYGIDIDLQYVASSTTIAPAMLSGEIQLAMGSAGAIVSATVAGGDLILLASTNEALPFSLYVVPAIQRIEDLRGKTVGATRLGSVTDYATRQTLKKFGLEPDKDVAVVAMGGVPELRAGLATGAIQGSVFGPPDSLMARKEGMRELVTFSDLNILYPTGAVAISKKYLDGNRDTVKRFMEALMEGIAIAKTDRDYATKVISQYSKIDDKEVLDETHLIYVDKLMPKVPYVTVAGMQVVVDDTAKSNPKAKEFKPEAFIDNSILKELDDSGFIKKLYGQ
ncbi:MAG: ABC transporter substrate-binding protein [Chloroflexi bacterium]|nr:ABC transporter substrate-binding protein [Chloroflexota bacterium]